MGAASLTDINASTVNATILPLVIDDATNRLLVTAVVTSNALPTGAATAAKQDTGNTSLASIDGKLPTVLGQATMANSLAVVLASNQSAIPITDNSGSLTVDQPTGSNLHTVVDSGTITTVSTVTGVTTVSTLTNITNWGNIVDNAAFTDGTTRLMPAAYIFDEVAGTALTENDAAAARIDSKRAQIGVIEDATTRGTRLNIVAEDAASAGGETGIVWLGVRRDADTSPVSADGDFHTAIFDSAGNLKVNIKAGGAGDGAILDGVTNTIKATVFDYANSNPLGVVLRDTNGDYVSVGGGTQYTEDAAAAADPVGTALNLIRDDSRGGSLTSANGDNVAARGTNAGELYVKHVDTLPVLGNTAHDGASPGNPLLIGGYAKAAAPTDVSADGDAVNAWFLRNGAQATVITAAGALVGGDAANGLDVDVTRLPALVAGSALIGKVGIDQTTPGTTNAVAVTNLPTTVDTNSGVKSASTIRVVLATDQPQLTNKLLVTPDANSAVNVSQINGVTVLMGNGASGTGAQRVTIANDSTGILAAVTNVATIGTSVTPGTSAAHLGKAEDAAHTTGDTGVAILGRRIDTQAVSSNASGDYSTIDMDANGAQYATLSASAGVVGTSMYLNTALLATKQAANASAGSLYGYHIYNPNSVVIYVQFFNLASASVTVGTTTPNMVIAVPPFGWADAPATGPPIGFGTAMTIAATTTATGSGAPSTGLLTNLWYK